VSTADQVAELYDFSDLYLAGDLGGGQTVAIAALLPYDPSDIAVYQRCYGTAVPVTDVSVDGRSGPFTQNTLGETALDIEQVTGLAPQAKILVYEAPSDAPFADILSAIVSQGRRA
jgi:subtilase family serine protease